MKIKFRHRMLSLLLCSLILYSSLPALAIAAGNDNNKENFNACSHVHTEECYTKVAKCAYKNGEKDEEEGETDKSGLQTETDETVSTVSEHVCSEESGCITKVLHCTHEHDEECGYFKEKEKAAPKITSWEWVDEEGYLVKSEKDGSWALGLPGASVKNPVKQENLEELLPKEILAAFSNGTDKKIPVTWDFSQIDKRGVYKGSYTITAAVAEDYGFEEGVQPPAVLLELGDGEIMVADWLKKYIVTEDVVSPSNVKINLFDYTVDAEKKAGEKGGDKLGKEQYQHQYGGLGTAGQRGSFSGVDQWNKGINENKLLIFGDDVIHAGLWNMSVSAKDTDFIKQNAGIQNIVRRALGTDGYPLINTDMANNQLSDDGNKQGSFKNILGYELAGDNDHTLTGGGTNVYYQYKPDDNPPNLSKTLMKNWGSNFNNESLAYLFDETPSANKAVYKDVKGLLTQGDVKDYEYQADSKFAEYDETTNSFILYNSRGVVDSGDSSGEGNFFPFNKGEDVLIENKIYGFVDINRNITSSSDVINHYFGMTMEIDFRQPREGKIGGYKQEGSSQAVERTNMEFCVDSDDDVWVFIDDVLVLDMGGKHGSVKAGRIDFATGAVTIRSENSEIINTTLTKMFGLAGKYKEGDKGFTNNTFANGTEHTLKMFYLERGNYNSKLSLKFNLDPVQPQQIKKVDQNGKPLAGAQFEMYAAQTATNADGTISPVKGQNGEYQTKGDVLASLTSGADGTAEFLELGTGTDTEQGSPFNFSEMYHRNVIEYYVLRETAPPTGYQKAPVDTVIRYNAEDSMLVVVNPWETGAYASFDSNVISIAGNAIKCVYDPINNDIIRDPEEKTVSATSFTNALFFAIPMLWEEGTSEWKPVYGGNTTGFKAENIKEKSENGWKDALVTAMLYQCADADTPDWYLYWDITINLLNGTLTDLPGRADRYKLNNPDKGDLKMIYLYVSPSALKKVIPDLDIFKDHPDGETYKEIREYINNEAKNNPNGLSGAIEKVKSLFLENPSNVVFVDTSDFNRSFRSSILVPNEQRELQVWKIGEDGKAINGAKFALYDNPKCTGDPVAQGRTGKVDGRDGVLVFTPSPVMNGNKVEDGYARVSWVDRETQNNATYYLKEINPPIGYQVNTTVTEVHVGNYSVYADAGDANNNVTVMAGVGRLVETMKKYAASEDINITLRDITANAYYSESGNFNADKWKPMYLEETSTQRSMDLHYGLNSVIEYGLHDVDGGANTYPFFVTNTGYITARVEQNWDALAGGGKYGDGSGYTPSTANKEKIDGDISPLFRLLNVVVVTDEKEPPEKNTGELIISKMVIGDNLPADAYSRNFEFTLDLTWETEPEGLPDKFYYYGTDRAGYIGQGETIKLHHDESITILGLPMNTHYKVAEIVDTSSDEGSYIPIGGGVREGNIDSVLVPATAEYINVYGTPLPFSFTKVDGMDKNTVLKGAEFAMYLWLGEGDPEETLIPISGAPEGGGWTFVGSAVSDDDGLVRFSLPGGGVYRLVETMAPDSYVLSEGQWQFEVTEGVSAGGAVAEGTIVGDSIKTIGSSKPPAFSVEKLDDGTIRYLLQNFPISDIPFTGGNETLRYTAFGAALLSAAAMAAIWYSMRSDDVKSTVRRRKFSVRKC